MRKLANKFIILLKENFFFKMYTLILMPVLIIVIFLCFSTYSYTKNYKELLKNGYSEKLEAVCSQNEASLQSIEALVRFLANSNDFDKAALSSPSDETVFHKAISKELDQIQQSNTLIDSACIYSKNSTTVYHSGGASHATTYFSYIYCYAQYPKSFFDGYKADDDNLKILSPTFVNNSERQKKVIPIIFSVPDTDNDILIIVNVNLSDIIENANKSKLTEHSTFLIVNNQNRNVFGQSDEQIPSFENNFYSNVCEKQISGFDSNVDGKPSLIMSYTPNSSLLGYSYVAIVPYSDINSRTARITYIMLLIGICVLIAVLIGAYFSAKRIYTPIENLVSMFDGASSVSPENKNLLKKLHTSIQETLTANNTLYNDYTKALPLVQERYLINFLNSNEHYVPDTENADMPIDFAYSYFCSIVIKLKPTDEFYSLYGKSEYNAIKNGIHNIIEAEFTEKYEVYIVPSENDTLYVLLNLPNDNESENILNILESFKNIMDYDKSYMTVKIGLGGIYQYLSGLKKSHCEAINSVSGIIGLTHIRINSEDSKLQSYEFGINEENTLLNHLILGHSEEARKQIEEILSENIHKNASDTAIIQLYVQILNVIFKVMRIKKIDYDTENSGDFHIITEIIKLPVPEIHELAMKYINIITEHTDTSSKKIDVQAVISYIDENYALDLGLDLIADKFNTTPKYLSKLIKDKLGINFVDYLSSQRITAAKKLLSETDMTVSDIYEQVGFSNRNTFIRTFKKNTGLTPSDYRKTYKKAVKNEPTDF